MWKYRFRSPPSSYQDELAHFGIKGQMWGIRRFQFENGSYTPEGKERYGRGSSSDGKTGGLFRKKGAEVQLNTLKEEVRSAINSDKAAINDIRDREEKLVKDLKSSKKQNDDFFRKVSITDADKEKIWEKLHKDFGNGTDDEDLLMNTAMEYLNDERLWKNTEKRFSEERNKIDVDGRKLAADIEKIVQPVIDKYKDTKVKYNHASVSADAKTMIQEMVRDNVLDNYWLIAPYLFNDSKNSTYNFYQSPEYWQAIARVAEDFTMQEYNKRYSK